MPHRCTNCGRTFADGSKEMLSGCPDCGGNKFQFAPKGSIAEGTGSATADSTRNGARESVSDRTESSDPRPDSTDGAVSRAAETVRGWVSDRSSSSDASTGSNSSGTTGSNSSAVDGRSPASGSSTGPTAAGSGAAGSDDEEGFTEWPDSARRPSDRSSAGDDGPTPDSRPGSRSDSRVESGRPSDGGVGGGTASDREDLVDERGEEDAAQADARSELVSGDELPPRSGGVDDPTASQADDEPASDPVGDAPDHGRVVSEPSDDDAPSLEDLRAELNDQFESIKIVEPGQYELNLMELYDREEYIVSLQEDGRYVIDVPDSWRDGDGETP